MLTAQSDLVVKTRWYIRFRWYLLLAVSVPGILSLYIGEGWTAQVQRDVLLGILAVGSNGIFYVLGNLKKSDNYYRALAISLLVFDTLLITYLIYTKGGIESRSPILYCIPILMSAAMFGRREAAYFTAFGSLIAYNGLIIADYLNIVHSLGGLTNLHSDFPYVVNTVIFFSSIIIIIGFLADYITNLLITKERQALLSAEALRHAQSIAKLGSWEWDVVRDKITWSDELYKLFNIDKDIGPLSYQEYADKIFPDDRRPFEDTIKLALKTNRPFSFDHRITRMDGKMQIIHGEGQVITDRHGKPVKMYGTARDVTSVRALETAKGDFVSLASHQLRTPATGVKILLSLLTEGYAGNLTANQKDILHQAYEANERQLKIANDLLNVARLEAGRLKLRKKTIDLGEWMEVSLAEHQSAIKEHSQKLTINLPEKPIKVAADPGRLYMVIDNLVSNASKYTPSGGTITVSLTATKSRACIAVKDSGIGIPENEMPKLFQKFVRIDNSLSSEAEGSGLGLYLVKNIVDLHKGDIKVTSKPSRGTTFKILLPLAKLR